MNPNVERMKPPGPLHPITGQRNLLIEAIAAHHEAGHAVIAHRLHVIIVEVSIRPTMGSLGRCQCFTAKGAHDECICMIAGPEAQAVLVGSNTSIGLPGSVADFRKVFRIVDREGWAGDRYLEIIRNAQEMVSQNWRGIQAVAEALVMFGRITGYLVRDILSKLDSGEDYKAGFEWAWHVKLYSIRPQWSIYQTTESLMIGTNPVPFYNTHWFLKEPL